jgi:pyridoxal phosphate enzyme (YggS family)
VNGGVDIAANLAAVRARIAVAAARAGRPVAAIDLLAVSKTHPFAAVRAAYTAGQRRFGENRVQELVAKAAEATAAGDVPELRWHLIGSLQTNKVRALLAVPGLELVHSVDRANLADALHQELVRTGRRLEVLLQVHATEEATKHGCPPADVPALLDHVRTHCPSLEVRGLMAMGPQLGDPAPTFARVVDLAAALRGRSGLPLPVLSLGMSDDMELAIAAGSTFVRVGSALFGARV